MTDTGPGPGPPSAEGRRRTLMKSEHAWCSTRTWVGWFFLLLPRRYKALNYSPLNYVINSKQIAQQVEKSTSILYCLFVFNHSSKSWANICRAVPRKCHSGGTNCHLIRKCHFEKQISSRKKRRLLYRQQLGWWPNDWLHREEGVKQAQKQQQQHINQKRAFSYYPVQ